MDNIITAYIEAGWSIVPIPPGTKGPRADGWNLPDAALKHADALPPGYGVGLMHAYSGTMALDIDDWEATKAFGIDLDALYAAPDAVTILSGREGRGKLLYRMPLGLALPTKRFQVNKKVIFELRCGTSEGTTAQDVLPPSIHPDTMRPYVWGGAGHWSRLPYAPQAILDVWQAALREVRPVSVDGVDASWDEIRGALTSISPDCSREDWISTGFALHWAGEQTSNSDQAFHIWNVWSKGSNKYPGERGIAQQWNSFRTSKTVTITLGTLFHLARQSGWVRPAPDASTLFGSVAPATPTDVMSLIKPPPPPVDLDLWPGILARRSREVSDGVGCDPLVPLWAGLGAICGVIDARTRLELVHGFKVPPVLWLMTLGEPADKKTPGSKPMLEPLSGIEAGDRKRFAMAMLEYEGQEAAYDASKANFLKHAASAEGLMSGDAPEVLPEPERPVPVKITVSDITSQKLVRQGADRPRGLLCHLDELSSWVSKLTNRSSGEDRSTWVVAYEASRYEMDRVGAGSIHAENFAVSIYGNIQPRVFAEHFDNLSQDGLLQRFLPAVLRGDQTRLGNPVPDYMTSADEWEQTLRLVYALPPMTYRLSPEAYKVFRDFQQWYEQQKVTERLLRSSSTFMTAFGKIEGLVGRLALVFHAVESPFAPEVSSSVIERVVRVVREYAIPVYRHLYDGDDASSAAFDQWVTEYIVDNADQERVTLTDVKRHAHKQFIKADVTHPMEQTQRVLNAMMMLEERGWVARADDGSLEHRHKAEWWVNPQLKTMFDDHRRAVRKAKADRMRGE